jgi:tRNA nucleotidyltransferase/poly(A) polymerase
MEMYMVGGAVRDELLGVKSKDIDFTVVLSDLDRFAGAPDDPFQLMAQKLKDMGFEIFLETPEYLTIRARFPKGHVHTGLTADFVLARKESGYTDGRRPDVVEPGTLFDDLARRDFTMNAIAKVETDSAGDHYIDPFNGQDDVKNKIIRCVGDPHERFKEDPLRIVRALRFAVTKDFRIEPETEDAMDDLMHKVRTVSAERVREEITKMFNHDPNKTIQALQEFDVFGIIFGMGINFQPTLKEKVR